MTRKHNYMTMKPTLIALLKYSYRSYIVRDKFQ